jgi:hypothetical protein
LFVQDTLDLLRPRYPEVHILWGNTALEWAVSCPVRHIACRSLQTFRVLNLPLDHGLLGTLIARLSSTIGDRAVELQTFSKELLYTLSVMVKSLPNQSLETFPQVFWMACSCIESPLELEFAEACSMLEDLFNKNTLYEGPVSISVGSTRPVGWEMFSIDTIIEHLVKRGLTSSTSSRIAWQTIRSILNVQRNSDNRPPFEDSLSYLYPASIPWAMQCLEEGNISEEMEILSSSIASLAQIEGKEGIARHMAAFSKNLFRSKEDFLRQAISCIREYYMGRIVQIFTLYMSLLLNPLQWLRSRVLSLLTMFVRLIDLTSMDIDQGWAIDLLVPAVRLSTTELATEAIELLEDRLPRPSEDVKGGGYRVFGIISESGWSVVNPEGATSKVRQGLRDVLDCSPSSTDFQHPTSSVEFAVEVYDEDRFINDDKTQSDFGGNSSLGDMVSKLHDLSSFFEDLNENASTSNHRLNSSSSSHMRISQGPASRVAQLLSRGTGKVKLKRMALSVYGTKYPEILSSNIDEEEEDNHRNKREFSSDEEDNYNSRDIDINWDEDALDNHNEHPGLY